MTTLNLDTRLVSRIQPRMFPRGQPIASRAESSQILIAEDQASLRVAYRAVLESAGYEVTEMEDGQQALDSLRREPADLALLDLRMPVLDGIDVLQRLQDEAIGVPVVIVTADVGVATAIRAIESGAVDVLAKLVAPVLLRETVLRVLLRPAQGSTGSYRPQPNSLGAMALRFVETMTVARRALQKNHLNLSEYLLQQALDIHPKSAEANNLLGLVREKTGRDYAAYYLYKAALQADPCYRPAQGNMRRNCERLGLDYRNRAINPAAE
jgi:DNA-binding response OmpR family regulator